MQDIKSIKPIISSEKKNAVIETRIITEIYAGVNMVAIAAIAANIVPIIPASRHSVCLYKHFDKGSGLPVAAKKSPKIKAISDTPPSPNAIQITGTIQGMLLKAKSTPTTAPNIMLIIKCKQLQILILHLLHSIIIIPLERLPALYII